MDFSACLIPLLIAFTALFALFKRVDVYTTLTDGAQEGLTVLARILPSLVALLTAVYIKVPMCPFPVSSPCSWPQIVSSFCHS